MMKAAKQTTLRDHVAVFGIGVHSGLASTLTLHPAEADTGIVFVRPASDGQPEREIRADVRAVTATEFATVLGDSTGPLCSTSEHLLAALRGLGVDNVIVEIDGTEVPIMDGSAAPFVAAIDQVGLVTLNAPRRYIEVLKPVRIVQNGAVGELRPYARGFRVEAEIDFDNPMVGQQTLAIDIEPVSFRKELAQARTFGFMRDVAKLWSAGYARGASFENTVVVTADRVLNPNGVRYPDEFVRHKVLDAIGDLALAGAPLLGAYHTVRGGHRLNHAVLTALMSDRSAWRLVEGETVRRGQVRGRARGHADVATGLVAPAFGPEVS
jgi:UDP-3-O-[3-hydroxymyristoyl] N-acetylglucosamine deacetylase